MEVTRKNFLTISKVEDQVKFPCTVEDTMTSKATIIHLDHGTGTEVNITTFNLVLRLRC